MNILIESMTKITLSWPAIVIRCWRQEASYDGRSIQQTREEVEKLLKERPEFSPVPGRSFNLYDIAKSILAIDRMNAVEVLDGAGNGVVLYADWP